MIIDFFIMIFDLFIIDVKFTFNFFRFLIYLLLDVFNFLHRGSMYVLHFLTKYLNFPSKCCFLQRLCHSTAEGATFWDFPSLFSFDNSTSVTCLMIKSAIVGKAWGIFEVSELHSFDTQITFLLSFCG